MKFNLKKNLKKKNRKRITNFIFQRFKKNYFFIKDFINFKIENFSAHILLILIAQKKFIKVKDSPSILFYTSKYWHGLKVVSPVTHLYTIPLEERYNEKLEILYWDENNKRFFSQINLILKILKYQPKAIFFEGFLSDKKSKFKRYSQPSLAIIKKIKQISNTKFVVIWCDSCSKLFYQQSFKPCKELFDLQIVSENPAKKFLKDKKINPSNVLFEVPIPKIKGIFKAQKIKDIDIAFTGQINSYRSYRYKYIMHLEKLKKLGYKVFLNTEFNNKMMTFEEYASILNRSKIVINFSYSVHCHQLKGRTLEAMLSGAMLLETKNDQTPMIFEDGKDFISFDGPEDMMEKIKFYLKNSNIAEGIAESGRNKILLHNEKNNYWDKTFKILSLNMKRK